LCVLLWYKDNSENRVLWTKSFKTVKVDRPNYFPRTIPVFKFPQIQCIHPYTGKDCKNCTVGWDENCEKELNHCVNSDTDNVCKNGGKCESFKGWFWKLLNISVKMWGEKH